MNWESWLDPKNSLITADTAAMAKWWCTQKQCDIVDECLQLHGGYGFMDETLVARHYRDAKILEIGEGTSEVQRLVISRGLGLPTS